MERARTTASFSAPWWRESIASGSGRWTAFFPRSSEPSLLELGLSGGFSMLDDYSQEIEKSRTLASLFENDGGSRSAGAGGGLMTGGMADFLAAFDRATFGQQEARLVETLSDFLRGFPRAVFVRSQGVFVGISSGDLELRAARLISSKTLILSSGSLRCASASRATASSPMGSAPSGWNL